MLPKTSIEKAFQNHLNHDLLFVKKKFLQPPFAKEIVAHLPHICKKSFHALPPL